MRHKIAFITTEYVKPHLERVLPQLGMDVAFSIYAYHPFEELGGFFRQIPREVDGVITSGNRFGSAFSGTCSRGTGGWWCPWASMTRRSTGSSGG